MLQVEVTLDQAIDLTGSGATQLVEAAAKVSLTHQGIAEGELTVLIAGDELISALNQTYRGMLGTTDVLSFPAGSGVKIPDLPTYLGDIAISLPEAQRHADEAGHSVEQELQLLTVHGTLHLLGFDHGIPADKAAMWSVQHEILTELGLESIRIPK